MLRHPRRPQPRPSFIVFSTTCSVHSQDGGSTVVINICVLGVGFQLLLSLFNRSSKMTSLLLDPVFPVTPSAKNPVATVNVQETLCIRSPVGSSRFTALVSEFCHEFILFCAFPFVGLSRLSSEGTYCQLISCLHRCSRIFWHFKDFVW